MTAKRYFEDIAVGAVEYSQEKTVTEAEIIAFAREYDPQYFHVDPEAAKQSRFGGLVASGVHNFALWRQLDHQTAHDIAWICGVGMDEIRLMNPLRPGDTVRARGECVAKRRSEKDPSRGVLSFRYSLVNQRDETVITFLSTNLVECRSTQGEP